MPIKKIYVNPIPMPSQTKTKAQLNNQQELTENVPGSTIKYVSGGRRIEKINTPPELLEQLKKDIAEKRLSPVAIRNKINRLTGFCSVCESIPEYFIIYNCNGAQKIERYCGPCLEKEKARKY